MQEHKHLRSLDMDDLLIMSLLQEGYGVNTIAKFLLLTPPAVSHRLQKYRDAFGSDVLQRIRCKTTFTESGNIIASKAKSAYQLFLGVDSSFQVGSLFQKHS